MPGEYETLWERRLDALGVAARYGASHLRIPAWAAQPETWRDEDLELLVDLAPGRSLLDHAALQLEIQRILGRHVQVINAAGFQPETRQRVAATHVPF